MANLDNIILNGTEYFIGGNGTGLTEEAKTALLACFQQVAWVDDDGQDYYDALESALYPPANLLRITCVYTQSGTVYTTDSLNSLKSDLVVTAHYDNGTTQTITNYVLSGTLTEGTSTITVSYGGKTTTFTVVVSEIALYTLPTITDRSVSYNIELSVSNGNHIDLKTTANARTCVIYPNGTTGESQNASTTPFFSVPAGASYEIKLKNITYEGNTEAGNRFSVSLNDATKTSIVTTAPTTITISSTGDGTLQDITINNTAETSTDVNVVAFLIYVYRAVTIHFDYELRINGVRYI